MLKEIVVAKAAINFIETTDPVAIARSCADIADNVLDSQMKEKRSEAVQSKIVPWVSKFCQAFCERLLEDQKKGGKNG